MKVYPNNFDRFHLLMFVQSCLSPEANNDTHTRPAEILTKPLSFQSLIKQPFDCLYSRINFDCSCFIAVQTARDEDFAQPIKQRILRVIVYEIAGNVYRTSRKKEKITSLQAFEAVTPLDVSEANLICSRKHILVIVVSLLSF